ncbi:hypothetical protein LCGC14_1080610 [marine sediment metagenome]|uniref:Nudix hydrolase domain-containing protein n=1 Tax=marine sediment metagenome TaxID=412755 RepID=A0A0F9N2Y1_9ZZZZ
MLTISSTKDLTVYKNKWLSVKKTPDNYYYVHEERSKGHLVAVLGWRGKEILGRYERCPAHSQKIELCSLTGGIDSRKSNWQQAALHYAQKELEEESGIKVSQNRFVSLGTVKHSKSADTIVHLFSIELIKEEPVENPKGDNSEGEKGAYCKWVSLKEAIDCKDPLVHAMILMILRSNQ